MRSFVIKLLMYWVFLAGLIIPFLAMGFPIPELTLDNLFFVVAWTVWLHYSKKIDDNFKGGLK